ncbi:flagellar basal body-associated FliL family protein [Acidisoma sp. 7E03]
MKKILPLLLTAIIAILIGAGGAIGFMKFIGGAAPHGGAAAPAKVEVKKEPEKKILFADLSDVTVSLPPQPGAAATSYVSFSIKFSTFDQAAILSFAELQPIIKSAIITRLMNETTQSLQDQRSRVDLTKSCLTIVNTVMVQNGSLSTAPFTAAYITNLVTQD